MTRELIELREPTLRQLLGLRIPGDSQERADRFYTLLKHRHTELRRIGAWLFGEDEVDARVPNLGSRTAAPRSAKDAAPQPATP